MDRYMDSASRGPLFLKRDEIAGIVVEALYEGARLRHYVLGPFVVMANHVHVLLMPLVVPSLLLKSIKNVTARRANRVLGRTGEPFWQRETYDRWVRDATEFGRIAAYIEGNPVKAGLVRVAEEFPWSSACSRWAGGVHRG
jgi:putative transposase